MRKTRQMLQMEQRHGQPIETLIMNALTTQGSIQRAADSLNVHPATLYGWMIRLRIQVKKVAVVA